MLHLQFNMLLSETPLNAQDFMDLEEPWLKLPIEKEFEIQQFEAVATVGYILS
jgi:hypothetical protein